MLQQSKAGCGYGPGQPRWTWRWLRQHWRLGLALRLRVRWLGKAVGEVVSKRLDVLTMVRGGWVGDGVVEAGLPELRMVA